MRQISFVVCVLILSGCGFSLSHRLQTTFSDGAGMHVPMFENQSDEVGAERVFTNAIIRELESRGNFGLSSKRNAKYELQGTVTGISYTPTALSTTGFKGLRDYRRLPTDLQVSASVYLRCVVIKTGEVMWSRSFSSFRRVAAPTGMPAPFSRTYDHEAPSTIGPMTQSAAESRYAEIARDISRDMYDEMTELF